MSNDAVVYDAAGMDRREEPDVPHRRADDAVTRTEFEALKAEVHINTTLTADIHAMVRSFKILASAAKIVGAIVGAMIALWHAGHAMFKPT